MLALHALRIIWYRLWVKIPCIGCVCDYGVMACGDKVLIQLSCLYERQPLALLRGRSIVPPMYCVRCHCVASCLCAACLGTRHNCHTSHASALRKGAQHRAAACPCAVRLCAIRWQGRETAGLLRPTARQRHTPGHSGAAAARAKARRYACAPRRAGGYAARRGGDSARSAAAPARYATPAGRGPSANRRRPPYWAAAWREHQAAKNNAQRAAQHCARLRSTAAGGLALRWAGGVLCARPLPRRARREATRRHAPLAQCVPPPVGRAAAQPEEGAAGTRCGCMCRQPISVPGTDAGRAARSRPQAAPRGRGCAGAAVGRRGAGRCRLRGCADIGAVWAVAERVSLPRADRGAACG